MAKIVFLDAASLTVLEPFERLKTLGSYEYISYSESNGGDVASRLQDASVVITNKIKLTRDILAACPKLKLIQITATGMNNVDLEAASELGITVKNVAGYSTNSTAQHAIALLLGLTNGIGYWADRGKKWCSSPTFWERSFVPTELAGKQLGVIGLGTIGRQVARIAEGLGMRVVGLERPGSVSDSWTRLSKETLLKTSDVVTLHCPLTKDTHHFIDDAALRTMKSSAYLINVGRGDLVDGAALAAALKGGEIKGAGVDVLSQEPPSADLPLLEDGISNLLITPHIAWASAESQVRLANLVVDQIQAFLKQL